MDFKKLAEQYKTVLMENVLPFWLQHSQDKKFGGYFTCLKRNGEVFDTDKFIWLQGREVWMFSMLYNKVDKRQDWLDCAIQGGEFLKSMAMTVTTTGISRSTVKDILWWSPTIFSLIRLLQWLSGS